MRNAKFFLLLLVVICSSSLGGQSSGTTPINIESVILRTRVVVLDRVVMKRALYVAFSLASKHSGHERLRIRGRLTRNGALLSEVFVETLLERTGNLIFDLPYRIPGGAYTILISAHNDRGNEIALGSRTLDRSDLKSDITNAREAIEVPLVEMPHAQEPEDPWLADKFKARGYVVFARSPLTYIFRESRPQRHEAIDQLSVQAVRNASSVLNFALYSLRKLGKVRISMSDLRKGGAVLSKSHIRLAWVESIPDATGMPKGQFQVLPALLRPMNADEVSAQESRRAWITIRVPKDVAPGTYSGTVTIAPEHAEPTVLPVKLTVVPISLEDVPGMDYCMLMTYEFVELDMPWSKEKKKQIYDAASRVLSDYRQHGMTTLCLHSPFVLITGRDGSPVLDDIFAALRAARSAGFSRPIVWYMGHLIQTSKPRHPGNVGNFDEAVHIARLKYLVATVSNYAKQNGLPEVVFLPIDEHDDSYQDVMNRRGSLAPLLVKTIREAGAKSMITAERYVPSGRPDYLASGQLIPDELQAAHAGGARYWRYDNRVTTECTSPAYARYQYGYYAWKNKIDGMSSWTFQNTQNASGVPGEPDAARDVYLAYPAPLGPVATIKWEAIRAGIDDRKLIYQLVKRVTRMKLNGKDTKRYDDFLVRMKDMDIKPCCNNTSCSEFDASMMDRQRDAIIGLILQADQEMR
jgi:hypothetical protein